MNAPDSITQAVRSMRAPPALQALPSTSPPPQPMQLLKAQSPPIQAQPSAPALRPSMQSSSGGSSASKSVTNSSISGDSASLVSDIQPAPYTFDQRAGTPPPLPPTPATKEWSFDRWMPLSVAAVTFVTVFSAGPLLLPSRLLKPSNGKPDKAKWVLAAGSCACTVFAVIHMYRLLK